MTNGRLISRRALIILISILALLLVFWLFAFEPITRNYVATNHVCVHCHVQREYLYSARMSFTSIHPPQKYLDKGVPERLKNRVPARCVDCHLPKGPINTIFAYTHFVSVTDLFGHFRDRPAERAGKWIPLSAARAYRVRDRLKEYDSVTCRSCHIMEEIVPESIRGKSAHKDAIANHETCIDCHVNLVHRFVEVRTAAPAAEEQGESAGGEDIDEFDEGSDKGSDEGSGEEEL